MSYLRISTVSADVALADLGFTVVHPTTNFVISDQFGVEDLQNSADLAAAINAATLTAQVNLDGVWTAVSAANFDPKDVPSAFENMYEIANTADNQRLVNGSDASDATQLHHHDARYYTEAELGSTTPGSSGGTLIGVDQTNFTNISGANVQAVLDSIDNFFATGVTLDNAYDNDPNGILSVDGTSKDLDFQSNNVNDVIISRKAGSDIQAFLQTDVLNNELVLGSAAVGALAAADVRIKRNIIIEGNLQITGSTTDTTVNELNVTNANIRLRDGATAIAGADGALYVERGTSGADAILRWSHTDTRWKAGLDGSDQTIALLEANEVVTGIWEMRGSGTTAPNMYLTNKSAAPSTALGSASQFPMAMIQGQLAIYDKTNSRNKFLSVSRDYMRFSGRDNSNNSNEYARVGQFTSNNAGARLLQDATLVGISVQAAAAGTWSARVRKNGSVTNLASATLTASAGTQDATLNVDFNAGDQIQVYIDGSGVNRPLITLEFAYRY